MGGDNPLELHPEVALRCGKQIVVDVRDDGQFEAALQRRERLGRIGKGRPITHGRRKRIGLSRAGGEAEALAETAHDVSQNVRIAPIRACLGGGLQRGVQLEHLLVGNIERLRAQDWPHRGHDPGFPVDDGAVTVEAQN